MVLDTLEAIAAGALFFALPGLAIVRAVFPEWRIAGALAITRAIETATLGFLLSLTLTILVGFGLTFGSTGTFPAGWSDPLLESILAAVTALAATVAFLRGGFAAEPPAAPPLEPAPGADSPESTLRELARLRVEARSVQRQLRHGNRSAAEQSMLRERLRSIDTEVEALKERRSADYAD
ncbi:MAG TPA: hypothetical protein VGV89_07505 [Thermoplasmata archaeon]|nr:hypothetical protein [Thermoplasmata archaeon]